MAFIFHGIDEVPFGAPEIGRIDRGIVVKFIEDFFGSIEAILVDCGEDELVEERAFGELIGGAFEEGSV